MTIRKKLRYFLVLHLILSIVLSAYGLEFGLNQRIHKKQFFQDINIQGIVKEDASFGIKMIISPFLMIFGVLIIVVYLVSWLGLFVFWRIGPFLFSLYVALSYLVFPVLSGWWSSLSPQHSHLLKSANNQEPSFFIEPLNYLLIILCGIILAIIFSKQGNCLFKRGKTDTI